MTILALGRIAGLAFTLAAPGIAAAGLLGKRGMTRRDALMLALPLSLATMPPLALAMAILLGTVVTPTLLVTTAAMITGLLWSVGSRPPLPKVARPGRWSLLALLAICALLALDLRPPLGQSAFDATAWGSCTDMAVYDTIGAGGLNWLWRSRLEDAHPYGLRYPTAAEPGDPLPWTGDAPEEVYIAPAALSLPADYVTNGFVNIEDQRLGNAALYATFVAFLGRPGIHLAFTIALIATVLATSAAARKLSGPGWPGALAGALALLAGLAGHFGPGFVQVVPDTLFAALLSATLLTFALGRPTLRGWFLAGMVAGTLLATRDVAVFCLVGMAVPILRSPRRKWVSMLFIAGMLITLFPTMYVHRFALGSVWANPTMAKFPGEGLTYTFLGTQFTVPLFLNWPFYHTMVRTPTTPFPTALFLPLVITFVLGTGALALALVGIARSEERRWVLALWILPLLLFLALQEDWDVARTSLIHLLLPALWVAVPVGIRTASDRKGAVVVLGIVLILSAAVRLAAHVDAPPDSRWSEVYGDRHVDEGGVADVRERLLTTGPFPLFPEGLPLNPGRLAGELARADDPRPLPERPWHLPRFDLERTSVHVDLRSGPADLRLALLASTDLGLPRAKRKGDAYELTIPRKEGGGPCALYEMTLSDDGNVLSVGLRPFMSAELGARCPPRSRSEQLGKVTLWTSGRRDVAAHRYPFPS
ncbi:MAG: hypothetical protein QF415_06235 [Candidatus Undinarchaeales archaeon]|jgi:hypothetical protein|nr:hypothetical protein [Candidatus Undinarchaeales archaeon]MDP7492042.1 hypothetical protein [Candidatus Undinarchaeales archaeon]